MAKKQDTKKAKDEKPKAGKAPAKAKSAKKSASVEASARRPAAPKSKPEAAAEALRSLTAPIPKASAARGGKAKKAAKPGKGVATRLIPDLPKLPQAGTGLDVMGTAKDIGNQLIGFLNTDAGRVIAAEVLIYMAKSLTRAAANTEAGKDATETMLSAGARIGAAMASAGAQAMENGSSVAEVGAQAATSAATSATDVAREVAQVAVSTVGTVVADAASKMIRGRKKSGGKDGETQQRGSEQRGSDQTGTGSPAMQAAASTPA